MTQTCRVHTIGFRHKFVQEGRRALLLHTLAATLGAVVCGFCVQRARLPLIVASQSAFRSLEPSQMAKSILLRLHTRTLSQGIHSALTELAV